MGYEKHTPEDQILFLNSLCILYETAQELKSAYSVISALKKLISPHFPPIIQMLPTIREAGLYRIEGRHLQSFDAIEQLLKFLPPDAGWYNHTYWSHVFELCLANYFDRFEKHFRTYQTMCTETFAYRVHYIQMIKNAERCDFEHAENQINLVRSPTLTDFQNQVAFLCEKQARLFSQDDFSQLDEANPLEWALISSACILKKEFDQALFWAHKYTGEYGVGEVQCFKARSDFYSYAFLRAELANKNMNAAVHFLESKRKINNICIYDDFFLFRIFHIKNEKEKAQHHFNLFIANVEKYQLENRFDIEFRLSPELTLAVEHNFNVV